MSEADGEEQKGGRPGNIFVAGSVLVFMSEGNLTSIPLTVSNINLRNV